MNLLLLEDGDFVAEGRALLRGRRLKHLHEVHRAESGDALRVGRLGGLMGAGRILRLDAEAAGIAVESLEQNPPAKLPVTLLLALPRPKMLKRTLQTVASMGVAHLVLLNSYRVEKSFWQTPFLEPEAIREQLILGLEQARDTHGADGLQHAFEHLRTRHREQQGQRQLGRRVCVEADLQLGLLGVETEQLAAAHQAAQATDPQAVAALGPVHFAQVLQAPALKAYTVRRDEVAVFQQQQVHGRGAGGWSPRKLSSSSAVGRRTRPPNSRPTSNSSHIGTASMVCENTSGGVRIMPTTKQPTMT